ncbi:C39 family peptidase [Candidatus Roizmanbacteria bacterium]|nr:C39 family peptidase [Candidatus Roizmanbacteria bacterium]
MKVIFSVPIVVLALFLISGRIPKSSPTPSPSPTPQVQLMKLSPSKILANDYHVFQTFNNCGPAALSMALSYYGYNISQDVLGKDLRPFQNSLGDNDDKSVTLEELGEKAKEYGLVPYHRPNGNIGFIKLFIENDIPVIARTLLYQDEDIGHYRVVKGYDDTTRQLLQDDSMQGQNLWFSYQEFNALWKQFNFEYLVLVPKEKQTIAEEILGEDKDPKIAWKKAVQNAQKQLEANPQDIYSRFNLSVALYNIGESQQSAVEFERVENQLPFRTLWYQIEPIKAYYELKDYERAFAVTDQVLNNWNRAFSELYYLRGQIYLEQGSKEAAKLEFENALFYKYNYKPALEALNIL